MRELGNIIFGHGAGGYEVPRYKWSSIFSALWSALYGEDCWCVEHFDNEVFTVRPYDWDAECTCGFTDEVEGWWKRHPHAEDCWTNEYSKIGKRHREELMVWAKDTGWQGDDNRGIARHPGYRNKTDEQFAETLRLAHERGFPEPDNCGIAVWCSCGADQAAEDHFGDRTHKEDCRMVLPNFLHKPTGYRIEWYKYPFRDSYANQKLEPAQVRAIVGSCLDSIKEAP
jgi:hypothetical protein